MNLKEFLLRMSFLASVLWVIFCFWISNTGIPEYGPIDHGALIIFSSWLVGPLILLWSIVWVLFGLKHD